MKFRRKSGVESKISTSSMPDIIFMLLIFFMVTTVLRQFSGLDNGRGNSRPDSDMLQTPDGSILHFTTLNSTNELPYGDSDDFAIGTSGQDFISTLSGDDFIAASQGQDYINAGSGNDIINISSSGKTVDGGTGIDTIFEGR